MRKNSNRPSSLLPMVLLNGVVRSTGHVACQRAKSGSPLQVYKDRNVVAQLVRRAERAGFSAIALTVDTPRLGRREADIKNR